MGKLFRKRKNINKEEIAFLENRLEQALVPIEPRQEFIVDLKHRLLARNLPVTQKRQIMQPQHTWLIAGGFVGALLLVLTWIKSFISVASMVGLLYYHLQQNKKKKKSLVPG